MTITFAPLPSLAPARCWAPDLVGATWQRINGSTAWEKSVFHTVPMRINTGSP